MSPLPCSSSCHLCWAWGHPLLSLDAISVGVGVFLISYSLLTKYQLGVLKMLSFPSHLAIDKLYALVLAISPRLFPFTSLDFVYFVIVAIRIVLILLVTMPKQPADRIWR